jgi:FkbM family methyltransferase
MRYSQYEEDDLIAEFFGQDYVGTFLDLGAANGSNSSNTRALALRGWSGWLVEPHPYAFSEMFNLYRQVPNIHLIHAAISASGEPIRFYHSKDQLSTGFEPTVKLPNMQQYFNGSYLVPTLRPSKLYDVIGRPKIDFVSLDCEGMDLEIAESSVELFKTARLLCYEHDLPGCHPSADYDAKWRVVLEKIGFTKVFAKTEGNTLVSR